MYTGGATLVLVRHGESHANAEGLLGGVLDSPLTDRGIRESRLAAALLVGGGVSPTVTFTSALQRTRQTANIVAEAIGARKIRRDWRLNERNYGALTGQTKSAIIAEHGMEQFLAWRRSVEIAAPPMDDSLFNELARKPPFNALPSRALGRTECLRDVIYRVSGFFRVQVRPFLARGSTVMIVAHGSSLRALRAVVDDRPDDALGPLTVPRAQPLIYRLDDQLRPIVAGGSYLDEPR